VAGHVFHPGHEELHGVTVVVTGNSGRTYVGRYHEQGERGVVMHDVGVHDPASAGLPRVAWLARQNQFGIRVDHRQLVVPADEVAGIRRLAADLP
jgi:hypothetical protein